MTEYLIVIEREGDSYGAFCPDLPGCVAVGDSAEEVERLMREGIPFHIDSLLEHGEPVPEPTASAAGFVEVAFVEVAEPSRTA